MIPRAHIIEWQKIAPWKTNSQIEQDLVICRALIAIFSDDFLSSSLAFRGGTALHKLYLHPQPRYSEDIDLVQIRPEPIKETIQRLQEKLSFIDMEFVVDQLPSRKQFIQNMEAKMQDAEFLGDSTALIRTDEKYNQNEAYELVRTELIERL